jgi:predicted ATP-grasp superfamily ATP-dependent carboligase
MKIGASLTAHPACDDEATVGSRVSSPGAVVIGGYVNGLGVVRALAARGISTAVVTTQPFDIAHRSRAATDHDAVRGLADRLEVLIELLERRAPDWRGRALFPTNDEALAALARHHDRLSSLYRVVSPPREVARYLLDKGAMDEVAQAAGAEVTYCYGPADEATAGRPDVRFPVVVKPLVGYAFAARFGAKLFVARDRDELRRAVARLAAARIQARVLDLVPGPDSRIYAYCTYVDGSGDTAAGVTVRKLRQSPPGFGVARVAEIAETPPGVPEITSAILRRTGLRGMAIAEFKHDPRDGSMRFIELNGRSVVYNRLLQRAGLDLAALAWSDQVGGAPERAQPNGWPGAWVNLHADVLYSALDRRNPIAVADFLAPYRRRFIEAVWSPADPMPFLAQWARTARQGTGRLLRKGYLGQSEATARYLPSP